MINEKNEKKNLSGLERSETHRLQADLSASRVQISSPASTVAPVGYANVNPLLCNGL